MSLTTSTQPRIERVGDIARNWHWIEQILAPAVIEGDKGAKLAALQGRLIAGRAGLISLHVPNGAMLMVLEPRETEDAKHLWVTYLAGQLRLPPKVWLRTIIAGLARIEDAARVQGFTELRLTGRHWPLPGYEPDPARPKELRKRLN